MNFKNKKKLIARVLKVGVGRIKLNENMMEEIKEAITRQDIRDLRKNSIIKIKEKIGTRIKIKRKTKKRLGSRKKTLKKRKKTYVKLTRKLRAYIKRLKNKGELSKEKYYELRKKIRAKAFRDFSHLRENIMENKK